MAASSITSPLGSYCLDSSIPRTVLLLATASGHKPCVQPPDLLCPPHPGMTYQEHPHQTCIHANVPGAGTCKELGAEVAPIPWHPQRACGCR